MNKKTKQKNGKILGSASADSGASSIYITPKVEALKRQPSYF